MDILDALKALYDGKAIQRKDWDANITLVYHKDTDIYEYRVFDLTEVELGAKEEVFTVEDILADDWMVVEDEKERA